MASDKLESSSPPARSMRTDARRNRARLIEVAVEVFTEFGVDASLNEIAKRAGVGSGTLYRHFASRDALLRAVVSERFQSLTAYTRGLLTAPPDGTTLRAWLRSVIDHLMAFPGLASSIMAVLTGETSELTATCDEVRRAGEALLDRLKKAGVVDTKVEITELLMVVNAIALATDRLPDGRARAEHLLELVLQGVETRR